MSSNKEPKAGWAGFIVRVAGLWILAGALFKLFRGTPADLPGVVRDLPLELGLTYKLAISAELCVAALALLRPRWGWLLLCAVFLVFDAILIDLIRRGEADCGCFGSDFPIPPWAMLAIDTVLLVLIVLSKPWRPRKGAPFVILAIALALGLALPWIFDRQLKDGVVENEDGALTNWKELSLEDWVGMDVWDTPLGKPPLDAYIDVAQLPLDGLWIFYRQTCDHCAEHLSYLADTEVGERLITLVQLAEKHDTEGNRVVHRVPVGNFVQTATLPDSIDYIVTTPSEMTLEGGRIVTAEEGVTPPDHASH